MNVEQREALKLFLMVGAPIMLTIGAILPTFLIFPIVITLYFGAFMGAYILGDIVQEQEKWKTKVVVFSSIIIALSWASLIIEL